MKSSTSKTLRQLFSTMPHDATLTDLPAPILETV